MTINKKEDYQLQFADMRLLRVKYWNFADQLQEGELMVHYVVAQEVIEIFQELWSHHFQIDKMRLIDAYGLSDLLSMKDNNTSAFNYRVVAGEERLSNHSYGLAIDINPIQNPYMKGEIILPYEGKKYLDRTIPEKGKIQKNGFCYEAFHSRGWIWGGDWDDKKDYHHFEKKIEGIN